MTEKEWWKEIDGFPGYFVSTKGRIWSERTQKILSPRGSKSTARGKPCYLTVSLRTPSGKSVTKCIHVLVAKAFIPNPMNAPVVRHLDDDRRHNDAENLAWGTYTDNYNDALKNGIKVGFTEEASKKGRDSTRDPVFIRSRLTNQRVLYESLNEAARSLPFKASPADLLQATRHTSNGRGKLKDISIEYLLRGDRSMTYINTFPEYQLEVAYETVETDAGPVKKRVVHNWFRGVDLGIGGYIVGQPGIYYNVVMLDISSMHPSSIIALNLFGDEYTQRFKELVDARIAIKHGDFDKAKTMLNGDLAPFLDDPSQAKALANALKLAINSVYGMTYQNYEGNPFYDKRNVNNIVALRGAIFMKMLQDEMTARGVTVVGIRTDSIKLLAPSPKDVDFAMEFGKKYGYSFEFECVYDRMCLSTKSDYVAKYMSPEKCKELYGWVPEENEKLGGQWTATAKFFSRPYVFKKLFSHEEITFEDLCETKERRAGSMFLDLNEELPEGAHNYVFVGRVGSFCPISSGRGGGELMAKVQSKKDGAEKYDAVAGTKGYRWLEAEQVKLMSKEADIDMGYFHSMVDDAIATISQYGDFEQFVGS